MSQPSSLDALVKEISSATAQDRLGYEAKLDQMIQAMESRGEKVPVSARDLLEELVNEKIENQFDNMPV